MDRKIVGRTEIGDPRDANRPGHLVMAVTVEGERDILGIWAGDGGAGAKYWRQVTAELRNRGLELVLILMPMWTEGPARRVLFEGSLVERVGHAAR
jgi:transposase-like protein